MKTVISSYDYSRVKRMSMSQLNDYILGIYLSGKTDMRNEICGDSDEVAVFPKDDLQEMLLSVKGIGPVISGRIINTIFKGEE